MVGAAGRRKSKRGRRGRNSAAEAASQDPSSQNHSPRDPSPQDPAPQDSSPQDLSPQDPAPQDPSPQDPAPQDSSPQDPRPQDHLTDASAILSTSGVTLDCDRSGGGWTTISCSTSNGPEFVQNTTQPLSSETTLFAVKLVSLPDGKTGHSVLIGLCSAAPTNGGSPWRSGSVRFETTNGRVFEGNKRIASPRVQCAAGDIITLSIGACQSVCSIHHNDKLLLRCRSSPRARFATVSGSGGGECRVDVRWPTEGRVDGSQQVAHLVALAKVWSGSDKVITDGNKLRVVAAPASVKRAFSVQREAPLIPDVHRHEYKYASVSVKVTKPADGVVAIGVGEVLFDPNRLPGEVAGSIGYHSNGMIKFNMDCDREMSYGDGDKVTVGIIYSEPHRSSALNYLESRPVLVYFTKNGKLLFAQMMMPPAGGFYPVVGISKEGGTIKVKRKPEDPPTFTPTHVDILTAQAREAATFRSSVRIQIEKDVVLTAMDATQVPRLVQRVDRALEANAFFRVKVVATGEAALFSVGVATSRMPVNGWWLGTAPFSCGYVSRDASLRGFGETHWSQPFGQAGSVGVWLQHLDRRRAIAVYVDESNRVFGKTVLKLPADGADLFPAVTLLGTSCTLVVEWPGSVPSPPPFTLATPAALLRDVSLWFCCNGVKAASATCLKLASKSTTMGSGYVGAQSLAPLSRDGLTYFEAMISSSSPHLPVIVGLAPSLTALRLPVGSTTTSFAVDVSRGRFLSGKVSANVGTTWSTTDRLGVGVRFQPDAPDDLSEQHVTVLVLKNGVLVLQVSFNMAAGGLFPMASMSTPGDSVEFDFNVVMPPLDATSSRRDAANVTTNDVEPRDPYMDEHHDDDVDVDNDDNPGDVIHRVLDPNDQRPWLHVTHATGRGRSLVKSLAAMAKETYHVSTSAALFHMEHKMAVVPKVHVYVVVVTMDAVEVKDDDDDDDDDFVQELLLVKGRGRPFAILRTADVAWPPGGALAEFEHSFKMADEDKLVMQIDAPIDGDSWKAIEATIQRAVSLPKERAQRHAAAHGASVVHLGDVESSQQQASTSSGCRLH